MLWKCCTQYVSKFGKLRSGHRTGKFQFSFQSQKKGDAKECSNYHTVALISHTSKMMLKILQARLQQHVNRELADVQAGFRKGRGTRDQIANIHWIIKKARECQKKHLFLLYWLCQRLWLCGSQQTVENSETDWKRSVFIPISKKGNAKECSNYHTIAHISHASKVMLKILKARLNQNVNHELPDVILKIL